MELTKGLNDIPSTGRNGVLSLSKFISRVTVTQWQATFSDRFDVMAGKLQNVFTILPSLLKNSPFKIKILSRPRNGVLNFLIVNPFWVTRCLKCEGRKNNSEIDRYVSSLSKLTGQLWKVAIFPRVVSDNYAKCYYFYSK